MYISCNQDFKSANPNTRQIKRIGKYLISSVVNHKIDSFYKKRQTIIFG